MSSVSSVLTDNSSLSRADRAWLRIEAAMNLVSGAVIFALVVLAVYNVLGRKFFNAPVPGYVDWTEQFMAAFAFLGLAYCQREGGHIRMDALVGHLRGRALWLAEFLSSIFMLLLATALAVGAWHHFERSFDLNSAMWSRDSTIDVGLPLWPSKLLVPLSIAVLWIRLALQIWGYWRAFASGDERPVGVVLPADSATQAAREAEGVGGRDDG